MVSLHLPLGFSFTSEYITRFNWNREYNSCSSDHLDWGKEGGRASRQNTTIFEWQVNNILKWNKEFGDHSFDATFVQNAEMYQYWRDFMHRRQFQPSDILGYHRMQAATEDVEISSDDQKSTGDALLGRLNYIYKDRYLLTGSVPSRRLFCIWSETSAGNIRFCCSGLDNQRRRFLQCRMDGYIEIQSFIRNQR